VEERLLPYHIALDYFRESSDRRILPRVFLSVELFPGQVKSVTTTVVLDTGAQVSVLDGNVALQAGWAPRDIVERAINSFPIYGLGPGAAIPGYVHEVTGYLGGFARFAELKLRVLITMPDRLAFSVLGRSDFLDQVDETFAELDRRLYFRFRDPSVLRS
jgi:hypothetical protein